MFIWDFFTGILGYLGEYLFIYTDGIIMRGKLKAFPTLYLAESGLILNSIQQQHSHENRWCGEVVTTSCIELWVYDLHNCANSGQRKSPDYLLFPKNRSSRFYLLVDNMA